MMESLDINSTSGKGDKIVRNISNTTQAPKLKLVEYDESDSSNDSSDQASSAHVIPKNAIDHTSNLKDHEAEQSIEALDNDCEKSKGGITAKKLLVQDINVTIMGEQQKQKESGDDFDLCQNIPNNITSNVESAIGGNSISKKNSELDVLDDMEKGNLEHMNNENIRSENLAFNEANEIDIMTSSHEDVVIAEKQLPIPKHNLQKMATKHDTIADQSMRSILTAEICEKDSAQENEYLENESNQVTDVGLSKFAAGESLINEVKDELARNVISTKSKNLKQMLDTDDELEFFDCEGEDEMNAVSCEVVDVAEAISDPTIQSDNSMNKISLKEQTYLADDKEPEKKIQNLTESENIKVKNDPSNRNIKDYEINIQKKSEGSSAMAACDKTAFERDHTFEKIIVKEHDELNLSLLDEKTVIKKQDEINETEEINADFNEKILGSAIAIDNSQNLNSNLKQFTKQQDNILKQDEQINTNISECALFEERRVEPLKLNLAKVDLSLQKMKQKRLGKPFVNLGHKLVKGNTEHEPITNIATNKIDETQPVDPSINMMQIREASTPKLIIKPIKKPIGVEQLEVKCDLTKSEEKSIPEPIEIPKLKLKLPLSSLNDKKSCLEITSEVINHAPVCTLKSKSDSDIKPKLTLRIPVETKNKDLTSEVEIKGEKINDVSKLTVKPVMDTGFENIPKLTLKLPTKISEHHTEAISLSKANESLLVQQASKSIVKPVIKLNLGDAMKFLTKSETSADLKEQNTDTSTKGENNLRVPKLMLKLQSELSAETRHQQSKDSSEDDHEEDMQIVPKLTIKLPPELNLDISDCKAKRESTDTKINDEIICSTVPKLTVKVSSTGEHRIENLSGLDVAAGTTEETAPKLVTKSNLKINEDLQVSSKSRHEQELVPKLTLKLSSNLIECKDQIARAGLQSVPKVTIKPLLKHDAENIPKSTFSSSSDLTIDGGERRFNDGATRSSQCVPKLTIKPLLKPESDIVPKLTLKLPSDLSIDTEQYYEKEATSMPKFTIKPIPPLQQQTNSDHNRPLEINTLDSKAAESGQESPRIIMKINKTKSEIVSPSSENNSRSPSVDKIKLKLSKTGQHPHIVHEERKDNREEDPNMVCMKRALLNPDLDVIEIKRPKTSMELYSNRLPDLSIERIPTQHQQIKQQSTKSQQEFQQQFQLQQQRSRKQQEHKLQSPSKFQQQYMDQQSGQQYLRQTEKQRSERRLKDILSRLHKKSNETLQPSFNKLAGLSDNRHVSQIDQIMEESNDNSSSSGDCILIEDSSGSGPDTKPKYVNFGRDIELINISATNMSTSPSKGSSSGVRGIFPRKRGRPKKDLSLIRQRDDLVSTQETNEHRVLDGLIAEGVRSRRNLRGRSPIVRGSNTPRGSRRGLGQSRRGGLACNSDTQLMPTPAHLNVQEYESTKPLDLTHLTKTKVNSELALDLTGPSIKRDITQDPLSNLQALTSSISIDLTEQDDSSEAFLRNDETSTEQLEPTSLSRKGHIPPETLSPSTVMKTPRARNRRTRGGTRRSRGGSKARNNRAVKESPLPMFEEDTRMSADLGNKNTILMPTKASDGNEESQSSLLSSTNENSKTKRARMEVGDCDGKIEFTVDQLSEYQWPQLQSTQGLQEVPNSAPTVQPESYMIQEQVALYLGANSFKRKYPDVKRRVVDMQERDFIMSKALVTETLCDLGLTAIPTCEVLDIMSSDFPEKYDEYKKYLRDKQAKELAIKQKAFNNDRNKQRSIKDRAISSASSWNSSFNKERLENRRGCIDLQTYVIQRPTRSFAQSLSLNKVGYYPVALVPGQYSDYYKHYSPNELRYFPLDTVLYGPQKPNEKYKDTHSVQYYEEYSESSSSSSGSDSDTSSDESQEETDLMNSEPLCRLCRLAKPGQEFIQCSSCRSQVHISCSGLSSNSMTVARGYAWQCAECKTCLVCANDQTEEKMVQCERCDRAAHVRCLATRNTVNGNEVSGTDAASNGTNTQGAGKTNWINNDNSPITGSTNNDSGLINPVGTIETTESSMTTADPIMVCASTGIWSCSPMCGSCDSCHVTSTDQTRWRHVRTPVGMRQLCQKCALMWQDKKYCTICYRCVMDTQHLTSCKICGHRLHTDCVRGEFPSSNIDSITCLECSKRAIVRVSTMIPFSEASTNTPTKILSTHMNTPRVITSHAPRTLHSAQS